MNADQIWQAIDTHRARVCDLLAELGDEEWQRPSLCAEWTVREVAAHLTLQQLGAGAALAQMLRWPGSIDHTIACAARRRAAALTTEQIIAAIRAGIGSRRRNFGVTPLETLSDILVHSQDIAVPLGRRLDLPPGPAAAAATRVLSMRWPPPLPSARKVAGFRLTATDTSWTAGQGPAVRGPMTALLLVCCGRLAALSELTGDGAAELAARLAPRPAADRQ
jgi:uncharacterized protein (TIGR03083 family)